MHPLLAIPPPPERLADFSAYVHRGAFVPAPEMTDAVMRLFIERGAPVEIEDHAHLRDANIGFLWTDQVGTDQGREVLGTAEIFRPKGKAWQKARQEMQIKQLFGEVPDFIITLSAPYVAERLAAGDGPSVCALIDHELSHCGQAEDENGPRFRRDGTPIWCIRGHDVEEFVGVVARWGADAAGVRALVEAANRGPRIAPAQAHGICGTCLRRVV